MDVNVISFPNLNLHMTINRVAFTIFDKPVYWYGIIIAVGFVLGVLYAFWRARKEGLPSDTVFDLVLWGLPTCIICARIFYVIGDPSVLAGGFWKIIAIWEGGIAIYGAIIGAVIVGVTYCKVKKLNMGTVFDVCAPGLMIGQIIGRWGNFVNAEVYGSPTNSLFAMSINGGVGVQPLFLYESVWMLIGLIGLLLYQNHKRRSGEIFTLYVIWYGIGRAVLESFRQDEYILKLFGMPISQMTAVLTVAAAVCMLIYLYMKKKPVESRAAVDAAVTPSEADAVPDSGTDAVADNSTEETKNTESEPDVSDGGGQSGTPE